jgi:hypothetical protein
MTTMMTGVLRAAAAAAAGAMAAGSGIPGAIAKPLEKAGATAR